MNYTILKQSIESITQITKSRNWDLNEEVVVQPAATQDEIEQLEKGLGKQLPSQLKELLTQFSKGVNLFYTIEEDTPEEFSDISSGEFYYDLESILEINEDYDGWVEASVDEEANDLEAVEITKKIKDNKTVLFSVANGDLIVMDDLTQEVLYFDHEGDTMHGKTLEKSLKEFLIKLSKIGFIGKEGWQFEVLYNFESNRLMDVEEAKVQRWIEWLNEVTS